MILAVNRVRNFNRVSLSFIAGLIMLLVLNGPGVDTARAGITHDGQFWFPLYNRFSLTDKLHGWFEVNPRFGDDMSEIHQLLIRPALGYRFSPNISLWQGYAWVTNYEPRFSDEHRLYQQLSYRRGLTLLNLSTRTRMEERFIRNARGVALRGRQFIRGNIPLDERKLWAFVVYDEVFVGFNTIRGGPRVGFDQNRIFVGVNRKISPQLNVDIGYQNQIINNRGPRFADVMNHILLVQWFIDWEL